MTANPRWSAGLRTMCSVVARMVRARSSRRPANAPSAKTNRTGVAKWVSSRTGFAPSRSCIEAVQTTTASSSPRMSVTMNRWRPLIFFPAS
jgi:hypothetical protein